MAHHTPSAHTPRRLDPATRARALDATFIALQSAYPTKELRFAAARRASADVIAEAVRQLRLAEAAQG